MTSVAVRGMGRAELLALPAAIDLDTANRAIGLGRSKGYELARLGDYPCRVLRLGKKYRVITADLLRLLGIDAAVGEGVAADAA
ncbi:hypothetical protein [Kitasatospora sp. NRRL B-11411]|uniref:hypothetical protein n=2 Tax=Streptomycetaceae TaxID=2062 RepID=UPI0009DCBDC5|nr:hypothetical protein [Kitasatospora sp. NRRL B-11411]